MRSGAGFCLPVGVLCNQTSCFDLRSCLPCWPPSKEPSPGSLAQSPARLSMQDASSPALSSPAKLSQTDHLSPTHSSPRSMATALAWNVTDEIAKCYLSFIFLEGTVVFRPSLCPQDPGRYLEHHEVFSEVFFFFFSRMSGSPISMWKSWQWRLLLRVKVEEMLARDHVLLG